MSSDCEEAARCQDGAGETTGGEGGGRNDCQRWKIHVGVHFIYYILYVLLVRSSSYNKTESFARVQNSEVSK